MTLNKSKKIISIFFIGLFFISITILITISFSDKKDVNLSDKDYLTQRADSYSYFLSDYNFFTSEGGNEEWPIVYQFTFTRFKGLDTIYSVEVLGDTDLELSYDLNLKKGEFTLVMVNDKDEIIELNEGETTVQMFEGETCRFRIVGEGASGDLNLKFKENKEITFGDSLNLFE